MMRAILSFVKFTMLILLVLMSIYQTGELWFENSSDRNFFYPIFSGTDSALVENLRERGNILAPYQIGVYLNTPTVEYTVINTNLSYYEEIREAYVSILYEGVKEDFYKGISEQQDLIYDQQHYVMFLPYDVSGDLLMQNLGLSSSDVRQVNMIHSISIQPSSLDGDIVRIYLEEAETGELHQYDVPKALISLADERLSYILTAIGQEVNLPAYISTKKNPLSFFDRNILLPDPVFGELRYHENLYMEMPFIVDGVFDSETLKNYLGVFFTNPDIMRPVVFEDETRYTDGDVVVKYNMDGVLEYNRTPKSDSSSINLSSAITIANQFIDRDLKQIPSEVVISGYERSGDAITFYYDIGFNGYLIKMSDEVREKYGMKKPIEVTVLGSQVVQYKRVLRRIDDSIPADKTLQMPYDEVLDKLIAANGSLDGDVRDMYLAYRWDESTNHMGLYWFIIVGQKPYYISVEVDDQ